MADGSKDGSSSLSIGNHDVTVTVDDVAFPCQLSDRATGRTQTVIRGTLKGSLYRTGGMPCDLTKITSPGRFPLGNYRVVVGVDDTGARYGRYDQSAKKLLIQTNLTPTQPSNNADVSAYVFSFMAVGE